MSVITRSAVEKNLAVVTKQIASIGGGDQELKQLEARLKTETDEFVKSAISEKVERLKKAKTEPSPYDAHAKELKTLKTQLEAVLETMKKMPWYMTATRGRSVAKKKRAK